MSDNRKRQVRSVPIMEYLHAHKNVHVSVDEVMRSTALTRAQVLSGISALRTRSGVYIETVARGSVYVYRETAPTAPNGHGKRIFEEVGTTRDGRVIVQDEEGALYAATEL